MIQLMQDNPQMQIDTAPPDAVFKIDSMLFAELVLRDGDTLKFEGEGMLNGAISIAPNMWRAEGAYWVLDNVTPPKHQIDFVESDGNRFEVKSPGHPRAGHSVDLFRGDVPLHHTNNMLLLDGSSFYHDYAKERIYLRFKPATALYLSRLETAITYGNDCTLINPRVKMYANKVQRGAIWADQDTTGLTVIGGQVSLCSGVGLTTRHHSIIKALTLSNNGQMGLSHRGDYCLYEDCRLNHNNYKHVNEGFEAGATKISQCKNVTFRHCEAVGNLGKGFWGDVDHDVVMFDECVAYRNTSVGFYSELGGSVMCRNCWSGWNAPTRGRGDTYGGQYQVSNALIDVADCVAIVPTRPADAEMTVFMVGLSARETDRGAYRTEQARFVRNEVVFTGRTGNLTGYREYVAGNNLSGVVEFGDNRYHVVEPGQYIYKNNQDTLTFEQWQAEGRDVGGIERLHDEETAQLMTAPDVVGDVPDVPTGPPEAGDDDRVATVIVGEVVVHMYQVPRTLTIDDVQITVV